MNAFFGDLTIAIRSLIARPLFSLLIIAVLGAGLACVIFMMSMVNGILLRPLPFAAASQLKQAGVYDYSFGIDYLDPVQGKDLLDVRRQLADLADVAGFARSTMNLTDIEIPERDYGAYVSAGLFRMLGVAPLRGRDFTVDDQGDGAPAVAMLSYDLWQGRYGGDPGIVGRQIRINAQAVTVIGVMPEGFCFPTKEVVWMAAHLFDGVKADDLSYWMVLRRNAGASDAAIATALDSWFAQAAHADVERFRGQHAGIGPLENINWGGGLRKPLYMMFCAVFMLLLVACANAGNMMLARMLGRRQEVAVRVALGASRKRLIAYLLMESVLLSLAATLVAAILASAGVSWLVAWFRANDFGPAHWQRFDIDVTVLLFMLGAAVLTALATGLPAALSASNDAAANNLRDDTRSVAGGSMVRLSRLLVIGEVTLSCALLVSVGMIVRSIVIIDRTDIGIDADHLLTSRVVLSATAYPTAADQLRLFERMHDRFRSDSAVSQVTIGTATPGTYWNENSHLLPAGVTPEGDSLPHTRIGAVDDDFLATYAVVLQEGRFFDARDSADSPRVAVVDRRFAQTLSSDTPVLGRQFRLEPRDPHGATVTVVGVIGSVMLNTQQQPPQPTLLIPLRQGPYRVASITVRTRDDSVPIAQHLNKIMRDVDADTPLNFRDYATVYRSQAKTIHLFAIWFEILGIVALLLVGAGLYGVMAVSVGRRTREIGVRRALGAPNRQILLAIFARSIVQLLIGLVLGLGVGVGFAKLVDDALIQSGSGASPVVLLGVVAVMTLAALAAITIPARRALRVEPIHALRCE